MIRKTSLGLLAGLLLICSGCADSHRKAVGDALASTTELVDTLETIDTLADAQAARPKLDRIVEQIQAIRERVEQLGQMDEAQQTQLKEEYEEEAAEIFARMIAVKFKLFDKPEVSQELDKSLSKLTGSPFPFAE